MRAVCRFSLGERRPRPILHCLQEDSRRSTWTTHQPPGVVSAVPQELLRKRVQRPAAHHAHLGVTRTLMAGRPATFVIKDRTRNLPETRLDFARLLLLFFSGSRSSDYRNCLDCSLHLRPLEGQTGCISCDEVRTTRLLAASRREDCVCRPGLP